MDSIAHPTNAETASTAWPVDSVAATAGGFLRSLNLDHDQLTAPWITVTAMSAGAWIDISPPYGTPAERLDLIGEAAKALGAGDAEIHYLPSGSATFSNVVVQGDWAECPITVRTSIATTDLVDIETERAVEATIGELIADVERHYPNKGEPLAEFVARERRVEAADDDWLDAAAESRGGDE